MFEESECLQSVMAVIISSVSRCSSCSSQDILSCLGETGAGWFFYSVKMYELEDSMC